jgi:uncharacterized protein YgbK (DUF1537 family)
VIEPLVVLDDDPTGAQTLAGVVVLLDWSDPAALPQALGKRRSVHLLTNARAYPPDRAYDVVRDAAATARAALPEAHIVLRGDSTLRGHVLEEYLAVRDATLPGTDPVLMLVPALPSAGRVTVQGVHLIERNGSRVPLHETEYSRDGVFAYADSRLLLWAEARSGGHFPADAGREVHLDELRGRGSEALRDAIDSLSGRGRPAAVAVDAETEDDLLVAAAGLAAAVEDGARVVVRSAPAFVGVAAGTTAEALVDSPAAEEVLVVCGSYVPATSRQLAGLLREQPLALVEPDVERLASGSPEDEIARAARSVQVALETTGLAVLATPRERPVGLTTLEAGERIVSGLARTVAAVDPLPAVVVAKGGITSAVTLREGFGAGRADVVGPIVPGVSLWRAAARDGEDRDFVVVPGNVGGDDLLADLVARILSVRAA